MPVCAEFALWAQLGAILLWCCCYDVAGLRSIALICSGVAPYCAHICTKYCAKRNRALFRIIISCSIFRPVALRVQIHRKWAQLQSANVCALVRSVISSLVGVMSSIERISILNLAQLVDIWAQIYVNWRNGAHRAQILRSVLPCAVLYICHVITNDELC